MNKTICYLLSFFCLLLLAGRVQAFALGDSRSFALLESLLYETRAEPVVCVRWYPRAETEKNKIREQCFKFSREAVCGGELDDYLVWPDSAAPEPEAPAQAEESAVSLPESVSPTQ